MNNNLKLSFIAFGFIALGACGDEEAGQIDTPQAATPDVSAASSAGGAEVGGSPTNVYFGDTHLHTKWSLDAFLMQNRSVDPDTAYRFAKGLPTVHPYHRARVQLQRPLDFLAVTDHAEYLGVFPKIGEGDPVAVASAAGKLLKEDIDAGREFIAFGKILAGVGGLTQDKALDQIVSSVWGDLIDAAERHNDPGTFTTFLGWEWSSIYQGANLHRIVLMKDGRDKAEQIVPYGFLEDGPDPRTLWSWLDRTSERTGATFISIPHNSNISKGMMFSRYDVSGNPITPEHARISAKWEPIVEVTQVKGDSESHPRLSPNDEFSDFEIYENLMSMTDEKAEAQPGDFVRNGLMLGLELKESLGTNPFKYGMIGSTDAHTGLSNAEESNFTGKYPTDSIPENKGVGVIPGAGEHGGSKGWDLGAAGLAAVWAEENTREAIFSAFQRKETYATTGTRLKVRFFGGWDFSADDLKSPDFARIGYARGVPMGGDLVGTGSNKVPSFMVYAVKDSLGANLDRVQIVKGWLDQSGKTHEKVFDVVWAGDRVKNAEGKVPSVGNTVNLETARYENSIGAVELATLWSDPEFDIAQSAFYYVRVLEIPTPRHTLFDAVALKESFTVMGKPATIQERAYTSPIWYEPAH